MKDRSFSNDFLWSCVKENPQIVGLKEKTAEKTVSFPSKIHHSHNLDPSSMLVSSPFVKKSKQIVQEKVMMMMNTTPKKRARASSPTLVRQKSFRKEQNYCVGSTPNRGLRSPSPSRRFNGGESNRIFPVKESCYRNQVVSSSRGITPAPKRESFRVPNPSPKRESSIDRDCLVRRNDAMSQHISGKSDGKEIDVVMEDIDNPLIALDCFIFL
ncbi:hypothetical protein C2S51_019403 [Perilla frutescens var. frutescens]|nr:hypothetical protein C2S51_019403 [Perilla frutescens var. frutescens]